MLKRLVSGAAALIAAVLMASGARGEPVRAAGSARVEDTRIEIGENHVAYPQLSGLADTTVQQKINDDIVLAGNLTAHMLTLSTLKQSSWGLRVDYVSYLDDCVFSTVVSAEGKLPSGRGGQSNTALTYDLQTGERVTLASLFADERAAVSEMERIAREAMEAELSEYMDAAEITPLPVDSFYLDADGVTFFYPAGQLSYLSGYAGSCQFWYEELAALWRTDADGLPARMGTLPSAVTDETLLLRISDTVSRGVIEHVPAALGDGMAELVDAYRLVRTPDEFPGGRYFVLEAAPFRGVLLISDSMQAGYEHSVVEGVQLKRGGLCGLMIGKARREDWLRALGTPEETIAFTQGMAYDYGLAQGQSDVYRFGGHELRLHADQSGVLQCVQLGK